MITRDVEAVDGLSLDDHPIHILIIIYGVQGKKVS
jgi:hypothetical protein